MSGHSKWATTKRHKAVVDAKRSSIFTKLGNNITIAARKGGDPEMNFSLRLAIDRAKQSNMPKDNIERAVKRGTGELGGAVVEELTYEGFGPAKAAFIIEAVTDNKNRTASEIRHIFTKQGGSMGATGSVSWNFEHKGVITVTAEVLKNNKLDEEFELELIDNGAEDIKKEEEGWTLYTLIENFQKLKQFLDAKNIPVDFAELEYVAKESKEVNDSDKQKIEQFINALEENGDISNYYTDVIL
ncbi:YebC/PmpR family DNA-binding transcriptional regulator [Candidatus Falkowbacteria bacterium CG10_big_fil_rev_8_21_14_0_10_37_6]|uniref:Probable transcriptional regulatory protein COT95_01070 n=1 Tax=Candidatus Falkowbacteria bacterium CG10_big_fil_rev_8_21_14_0_10_37_6 TaxID=1974563 RepID=A0A2H0V7G1_9BACT|nr:MAG: YebC/PmpR family DNA-binding transcriptional regulator [Candidatus Falkowbacteria bacterium CG10_big_fil_rev_8_21_14_0_10_37_6]